MAQVLERTIRQAVGASLRLIGAFKYLIGRRAMFSFAMRAAV
ncbi:hypothetical protein QZM52_25840 [Burkholderia metallica]|uniref:Uncharacterized protein n=1 Tax=Burkholderia metallica TaxID=488729 RepID=A0ABT8PHT1_9BURK|nr:hypothetical protein [Burkholderia metallica]MDN7934704.1 hypothetical protein [Burkholderia metallica]